MEEIFLFNDTETTGFPKLNGGRVQEGQSRVCQIALLLTDSAGKSLCEFSALLKPDGWKVHEEAQKVHGFSTEMCDKHGLSGRTVFLLYARLAGMCTHQVAHNSEFDAEMMKIEEAYYNEFGGAAPVMVDKPWLCTMKPNTDIVKAPHKSGKGGYKWPSLEETLKHFCGRELGNFAHDAMYDVKACRDIFFAKRNGQSSKMPERLKA